jgi:hypothetical protein
MSRNPIKTQSPEQIARAEKRRVAEIEGAKALADYEKDAVAVRKNMERLRELRLAREAEEAKNAPPAAPKKSRSAKTAKGEPKPTAQKLSDYLAVQRDGGWRT